MNNHKSVGGRWGAEVCYLVLLAQLPLHIVLLRIYFKLMGQQGDVGSNYLSFWILVIVPATILFALASAYGYRRWVGDSRDRRLAFFILFGLADAVLLVTSFWLYAHKFQG